MRRRGLSIWCVRHRHQDIPQQYIRHAKKSLFDALIPVSLTDAFGKRGALLHAVTKCLRALLHPWDEPNCCTHWRAQTAHSVTIYSNACWIIDQQIVRAQLLFIC
eukprot:TRINITY_DN7819_c0_g1_i1.p1 TRINITY_DN7819_c0_g1~~TRINITY_DN7819_c0_g1_i1.p1  ORF type:complete len:105 (+),score=3.31 TRINITY_DN7819_c0_g1_i1:832-1146(+)